MATSDFVRANRGHKGVDSGYRATKGEGKRQLRRFNRRAGRNLIRVALNEIEVAKAEERAAWELAESYDDISLWLE